jgi:hypothetical protein
LAFVWFLRFVPYHGLEADIKLKTNPFFGEVETGVSVFVFRFACLSRLLFQRMICRLMSAATVPLVGGVGGVR